MNNGRGFLLHSTGNHYHSHLNNGVRHDKGKNSFANTKIYDGNWKDKKQNGKGENSFANSNSYDGNWKDKKQNGKESFYLLMIILLMAIGRMI